MGMSVLLVFGFFMAALIFAALAIPDARVNHYPAHKIVLAVADGLLVLLILAVFSYPRPADDRVSNPEAHTTIEIASFANAQEIEGHTGTFLSSGQIGEKTVFRYVMKQPEGTFTLEQLDKKSLERGKDDQPVAGVVVAEDATEDTARIEYHTCERVDVVADFLFGDCGDLIEFHVPPGTVSTEFELDPAN